MVSGKVSSSDTHPRGRTQDQVRDRDTITCLVGGSELKSRFPILLVQRYRTNEIRGVTIPCRKDGSPGVFPGPFGPRGRDDTPLNEGLPRERRREFHLVSEGELVRGSFVFE